MSELPRKGDTVIVYIKKTPSLRRFILFLAFIYLICGILYYK